MTLALFIIGVLLIFTGLKMRPHAKEFRRRQMETAAITFRSLRSNSDSCSENLYLEICRADALETAEGRDLDLFQLAYVRIPIAVGTIMLCIGAIKLVW